jgi:hypothetical protein
LRTSTQKLPQARIVSCDRVAGFALLKWTSKERQEREGRQPMFTHVIAADMW